MLARASQLLTESIKIELKIQVIRHCHIPLEWAECQSENPFQRISVPLVEITFRHTWTAQAKATNRFTDKHLH
jgi:hypothetical protein